MAKSTHNFIFSRNYIFTWCLLGMTLSLSCEDKKCGGNNSRYQYLLEVKATITPAKELYHLGDTVAFSLYLPRTIIDRNHDELETIANHSLVHLSFATRVDTLEDDVLMDQFLNLVGPDIGNARFEPVGNSVAVTADFTENNLGDWELQYRFVLKRTGVYFFRLNYFIGGERRAGNLQLLNECGNGIIELFHNLNDGANNNWHLLCASNEQYCTPAWDETVRDRTFDQHAGFVFKVVE
ncbi:hypothetical protein QWY85_02900 [Neolewinella lacunae]|uniref:Uncharacterized protein n=1 Tax=Neolewinella lacunae TaxID=1517758 RepID=A0A923PS34_9BACT|nr:hypothetical protein [Neolewinella lacunae]MBC6996469.1 hypothetical protein [Neolewinella lacunae]MDN3633588.1 hypothetical protein [Neolewinella lacunae]